MYSVLMCMKLSTRKVHEVGASTTLMRDIPVFFYVRPLQYVRAPCSAKQLKSSHWYGFVVTRGGHSKRTVFKSHK